MRLPPSFPSAGTEGRSHRPRSRGEQSPSRATV
jgi:hypothetical protein